MNDFETLIGKALADGIDPESLADQMTTAFNKAIEQKKAAEAKAKELQKQSVREKLIESVDKSFWNHVKQEHLTTTDAATLAFLIIATDTEFGQSLNTEEELTELFEHISNMLTSIEDSFKFKKEMRTIFGDIVDKLDFGGMLGINKRKDMDGDTEKKKKVCTCGTDRITKPAMSDKDKIAAFLRSL